MKNNQKVYLGCDVSTQTIGFCLLVDDGTKYGKIIELTHINPKISTKIKGIEQLFLKKKVFENFLLKYKDFGIDEVIIEEPLLRSNNVFTVSTLLRFNGMVSDVVYNILGIVPQYISSHDARKFAFPELMSVRKYGKNENQYTYSHIKKDIEGGKLVLFGSYPWAIDKKIVLQEKVSEIFPQIQWVYNSKGELRKENYDATDAYVAILGQINRDKFGDLDFKTKIVGESNDGNGNITINYELSYWDRQEDRKIYIKD